MGVPPRSACGQSADCLRPHCRREFHAPHRAFHGIANRSAKHAEGHEAAFASVPPLAVLLSQLQCTLAAPRRRRVAFF